MITIAVILPKMNEEKAGNFPGDITCIGIELVLLGRRVLDGNQASARNEPLLL